MTCNIYLVISFEKPTPGYAMFNIKGNGVGTLLISNLENMYEYIPQCSTRFNITQISSAALRTEIDWLDMQEHMQQFLMYLENGICTFRLNPVFYRQDICRC
jgi:hypothetical protein